METEKSNGLLSFLGFESTKQPSYLDRLEFILEEEDDPSGRLPLGSKLTYGTGILYLTGLASGSFVGLVEGIKDTTPTTFKLRKNAILNAVTKRGPHFANSLAIVSVYYSFFEFGIAYLTGFKDDIGLPIVAASTAGAAFKCTSKKKEKKDLIVKGSLAQAGKIGAVCGITMGAFQVVKRIYKQKLYGSSSSSSSVSFA